ncbi:hypothetical protein COLO4_14590 [Corchorus olitorius]|uniref:Uncharacterized protein n=1 Tax=Corchorus olitorius TaxID=93759 RepID=A0A1R3JRK0_9ROSI|nr:hypothetical protein COLO4_14590 [Corchorus olitorius]
MIEGLIQSPSSGDDNNDQVDDWSFEESQEAYNMLSKLDGDCLRTCECLLQLVCDGRSHAGILEQPHLLITWVAGGGMGVRGVLLARVLSLAGKGDSGGRHAVVIRWYQVFRGSPRHLLKHLVSSKVAVVVGEPFRYPNSCLLVTIVAGVGMGGKEVCLFFGRSELEQQEIVSKFDTILINSDIISHWRIKFRDFNFLKERKGGWRYVDTGQVLIESACSVDGVEEAFSTLLPMLPEIQYFRFNPVYFQLIEADVLPALFLKLPLTYGHVRKQELH